MKDCIFCKIVAGEIPSKKVYEDQDVLAFYDIKPSAPVHIVVIPKKHIIKNLAEATLDQVQILGKLQVAARKVAEKVGILEAFSYTSNSGEKAGQVIWHIHYHLKGGWKGGE
jgi:histidine triad (HIT) family protein